MTSTSLSDYENWLKLCIYVDGPLKEALLNVLHNVYNNSYQGLPKVPHQLYNQLANDHEKLEKLKKKKIINDDQWQLLFPANQKTISADFDISLIIVLLINCTTLPPPKGGWKQKYPQLTDKSVAAFCLLAREMRNFVKHYGNPVKLETVEFNIKWKEGDVILAGLDYTTSTEKLKHGSLDPMQLQYFKYFIKHLQNTVVKLQQVVDGNTTDIYNVKKLASEVNTIKRSITQLENYNEKSVNEISPYEEILKDALLRIEVLKEKYAKEISDLITRVDHVEEDIKDVYVEQRHQKRDIERLKNEQQNLQGNVQHCQSQIDKLTIDSCKDYYWNVHQTVKNFTGRKPTLSEIHRVLNTSNENNYSAVSLIGLGGIGKTETAAKYVHLHGKNEYDNVFWIQADTLEISLNNLASLLNIDGKSKSVDGLFQSISRKLKDTKCLFVFDNVEKFDKFEPILRNMTFHIKTHIIITSQFGEMSGFGISKIKIDVLPNGAALEVFKELSDTDSREVKNLIEELQSFPLAMQQALSYIRKHSISVKTYLEGFRKGKKQLLNVNLRQSGDALYEKTLLTVWRMAFDKLTEHGDYVAIDVLHMMAYMDGNYINPKTFLYYEQIDDEFQLHEIIDLLCEYSLISKKFENGHGKQILSMHKLVQRVLKVFARNNAALDKIRNHQDILMNILTKASDSLDELGNDEENIWFPHMYQLYETGVPIDLSGISFVRYYQVGCFRGMYAVYNHIFRIFPLEVNDTNMLQHSYFKALYFIKMGSVKEGLNIMDDMLIKYKHVFKDNESEYDIVMIKLWFANCYITHGDATKGRKIYETIDMNDVKDEMNDKMYANILKWKCFILHSIGEFDEAITIADEAIALYLKKSGKHERESFNLLMVKIDVSIHLNKLADAEHFIHEAENILNARDISQKNINWVLLNIPKACLCYMREEYHKSRDILQSCLDASKSCCSVKVLCSILYNLSIVYMKLKNYEQALKICDITMSYMEKTYVDVNFSNDIKFLKVIIYIHINKIKDAVIVSADFEDEKLPVLEREFLMQVLGFQILVDETKIKGEKFGSGSEPFLTSLKKCQGLKKTVLHDLAKISNMMGLKNL